MTSTRAAIGSQNFGGAGSPSALVGAGLDEEGAHRCLDAAASVGMTIIDTAFSYAAGASQRMIGSWLEQDAGRRGRMTIVDKVGVVERSGELALDLSFDSVIAQAASGRGRMGVAAVDVVLAHAPDPEVQVEVTLGAFGSLLDSGHAAGWGVSNVNAPTLEEWLDVAYRIGMPRPVFVENEYNLVERTAEDTILPICRDAGIGFLAYSPTARGLLTGKYRRGEPPPEGSLQSLRPDMLIEITDREGALIASITAIAAGHGVSNVAVAFAWLLAKPGVTPIAGPSKPDHMDAIKQALKLQLSDQDLQLLSST